MIQSSQMHLFLQQVNKQIKLYDKEKGNIRKTFAHFFGENSEHAQTDYIRDLKRAFTSIKDKKALTMLDLKWFYQECFDSDGKYSNPQLYGVNPTLSGRVYQAIKKSFKEHFPGSIKEYEIMIKKAEKEASMELKDWRKREPDFDGFYNEEKEYGRARDRILYKTLKTQNAETISGANNQINARRPK